MLEISFNVGIARVMSTVPMVIWWLVLVYPCLLLRPVLPLDLLGDDTLKLRLLWLLQNRYCRISIQRLLLVSYAALYSHILITCTIYSLFILNWLSNWAFNLSWN